MSNKKQKLRYTVKGWNTITVPTEAYFLAYDVHQAERMARSAGLKDPRATKVEPVGEYQS